MTEALPLTAQEQATVERFGLDKPEPLTKHQFRRIVLVANRLADAFSKIPQTPVYDFTKTSAEWAAAKGIYVLDASGWDRTTPAAFDASWGRQITESDFDARAARSHTRLRTETDLSAHAGTWRIG